MECLMPSEVARLVLGYLKSTGCQTTWESFLRESPDLKEYAECARRGREYPTNIGGKNLLQLLDTGYQMAQSQGACDSPGDLLTNIDKMVTQVKDMLSQLNSATGENSRRISDVLSLSSSQAGTLPVNGAFMPADLSTTPSPRPPAPPPHQLMPQSQLRTAVTNFAISQSSTTSLQPPHHPQLHGHGGDTLSYHLHTILPPMRMLQPPPPSPLKKKTPHTSDPRFEPPEKDQGSSSSLHDLLEQVSPTKGPPTLGAGTPEQGGREPRFGAYEEGFLAYMNSLPRPVLPRSHPPYVENEEPVRDTGIDLRKRTMDGHSSERLKRQPGSVRPAVSSAGSTDPEKRTEAEGCSRELQEASAGRPTATVTDPNFNAEPASEGFEITETQTELSEEIDVEGSSRNPSPLSEEAAAAASGVGPEGTATLAAAPMSEGAAETPPPHQRPPAPQSPVAMETPESLEAPPLPQRYPDPTSPRLILAQERSLVPSLSTPIKEVRFNTERFNSPRRKSLIPRRRLISACSPAPNRGTDAAVASNSPEESIEAILQELLSSSPFVAKLVENINQAVRTDGTVASCSEQPSEPAPEDCPPEKTKAIVSSQGINLPDSMIRDILNKTENDPVFEQVLSQMCDRLDTTNDAPVTMVTPKSKGPATSRQHGGSGSPKTPSSQPPTTPQLLRSIMESPCSSPLAKPLPSSPSQRHRKQVVASSPAAPLKTCADSPFKTPSKAPLRTPWKTPPKTSLNTSPNTSPTSPVRVLSTSLDAEGQTVTCISIPDLPEKETGGGKSLKTLADIVDSVLTPENKLALSQSERVPGTTTVATPPSPSCPSSPMVTPQQQAVFICQDGTRVLLRAEETVTAQLHHPNAQLVHPPGTVVLATGGQTMTPCKVVLSDICAVSGFSGQQLCGATSSTVNVIVPRKSPTRKRLPLLQPKGPVPSQFPSRPLQPAPKEIVKKAASCEQRSRLRAMTQINDLLKQGHTAISQCDLRNSTVIQAGSTVPIQAKQGQVVHFIVPNQRQPSGTLSQGLRQSPKRGATATTTLRLTERVSKEPSLGASTSQKSAAVAIICGTNPKPNLSKSPQLKSLAKVASRCISSKKHVRVLNFESCSEDSSDSPEVRGVREDMAKTIASIGTTLAGAMQRALLGVADGNVCNAAETSSPELSGERRSQKRKSVSKVNRNLKKSKKEDSLKSMDVNKFLDKIHK
ncbi:unnamed protein product [Ixodes pacificus]